MVSFFKGQRVRLSAFDTGEDVIPAEEGTVVAVQQCTWGTAYVVQVTPEDEEDDGLRDVTEEQIEGLVA